MSAEVHRSLYFSFHFVLFPYWAVKDLKYKCQVTVVMAGVFVSLPCFIIVSRESFQQISLLSMIFAINFFVDKLFSDKRNSLFLMYWVLVYITILNECWILKCFFFIYLIPFPCSFLHCGFSLWEIWLWFSFLQCYYPYFFFFF